MNFSLLRQAAAAILLTVLLAACGGTPPNGGGGGGGGGGGEEVTAAAAGQYHSLALLDNGTVLSWGLNNYGQLGNGTGVSAFAPVVVRDLTDVKAVAAGRQHSLALTDSGDVYSWGDGLTGQLGAPYSSWNVPGLVPISETVVAIAAVHNTSYAIDDKGSLWAWGANANYNLGDGTQTQRTAPAVVAGLPAVKQVAPAVNYVLVLTESGEVWAWGTGTAYPLGTGEVDDETTPVHIEALDGFEVAQLAAGWSHALALLEDGTLIGWGANHSGQLGGTPSNPATRPAPTAFSELTGIVSVAAGHDVSAAVDDNGVLFTWGADNTGIRGTGSDVFQTGTPEAVGLANINSVSVSSSSSHMLAVLDDGKVWAWGQGYYGQLGVGDNDNRDEPAAVLLP